MSLLFICDFRIIKQILNVPFDSVYIYIQIYHLALNYFLSKYDIFKIQVLQINEKRKLAKFTSVKERKTSHWCSNKL